MLCLGLNASGQMAFDKLHSYAINGFASYSASGSGHTAQTGDSAMDLGSSGTTLLTITDPAFLSALNAATAGDTLTVSLWVQLYQISSSSGFYFYSPSSSGNQRGFQAHIPWGNDNIYFDSAGCCDGGAQRVSADIHTMPGFTDDTWWNTWHHFVFLKNGPQKQIWIDGVLFLNGQNTGPLPTDINVVTVGSGIPLGVAASLQGQIDDFAIFGSGLSSNDINAIYTGTSPDALTGDNLLALWTFDTTTPVLAAIQAGPGTTAASPDIAAYLDIMNSASSVQLDSIKLAINGTDVTPSATIVPDAVPALIQGASGGATVYYASPAFYAAGSTQLVTLAYHDDAVPANSYSNTWPIIIQSYNGFMKDSQNSHAAFLEGGAAFTLSGEGHTSTTGDRAIDLEGLGSGGDLHVGNGSFLNLGAANNTLSVSLWMKMHRITAGGTVWARSVLSGGQRGFAVMPWSDDNIYFDTAGCCDPTSQRFFASITTAPGYVDDSYWTTWHHYAFVFNGGNKEIWIDGMQLAAGYNSAPLPTDFKDLFFGYDPSDGVYQQAVLDDIAVYGTPLSPTSISDLALGTSPSALTTETLLAYWDCNTVSGGPPFISQASTPAPGSSNAPPNVGANIVIVNGTTQVDPNTIRLKFNGKDVTSSAQISPTSAGATVTFISSNLLAAFSSNTLTVVFSDNATPATVVSNTWWFVVGSYGSHAQDAVRGYLAMFLGTTHFTVAGEGHTGDTLDRALDLGTDGAGGAVGSDALFLNALNTSAGQDTMSISFWLKQSAISQSSAFWFNSPSVGGGAPSIGSGGRNLQAHTPWSDSTIYYDTAGCCNAPQRISANIGSFGGYSGDPSWWQTWHHFVFVKNGGTKQIWIDGQLFLEGTGAAPLATDMNKVFIGNGAGSPHGQLDDFAIFGEGLSSDNIAALFSGTSPSALGDPNLLAYWSFNDVGPAFLLSRTPAPNAAGVAASGPAGHVVATVMDGSTALDPTSVRLLFNGTDVSAQTTLSTPTPGLTRIDYGWPLLASASTNRVTLLFSDNATPPNLTSNSWTFITEAYTAITKDVLHGYPGLLQTAAQFTPDAGGHTGQPGDLAIDLTAAGGAIHIDDATFLYPAETNNTMSFAFWCKKYDIASSSAFWVNSPSSSGSTRGFQAHLPWGDDTIYYDTSGCCDGNLQRINASIHTLAGFTDDTWWNDWHHFVFLYNAGDKQIWIDGAMFLEGTSSAPLAQDFTDMFLGRDPGDGVNMHGVIDDFAAFSTPLSPDSILSLYTGSVPTDLPNETLLAYWNFNDSSTPTIGIARVAGKVTINFVGKLYSATVVTGPYTEVVGASSPYTPPSTTANTYYRAQQ
jgi:hypothetical protein